MSQRRIDVHAHFVPEVYEQALLAAGITQPDGIKAIPSWSEELHLATMDRLNIDTAMLSISTPGVHFGNDAEAAALARAVNDQAAALRSRHPDRFGFFASLPLPDVDAALAEVGYALDDLQADGVVIQTNSGGVYLGDARLEPLYAEIARRGTVLFLHPTTAHNGEQLGLGYPRPMLEFMFDTTRSVTNMILAGVLDRYRELKVIVPHAGAALPVLANRVELLLPLLTPPGGVTPPSVRKALRKLHFDLAGAPVEELLAALLSVADPALIHYGSDFPFTPADACVELAERLDHTDALAGELRDAVDWDNSLALFPRLASNTEAVKV